MTIDRFRIEMTTINFDRCDAMIISIGNMELHNERLDSSKFLIAFQQTIRIINIRMKEERGNLIPIFLLPVIPTPLLNLDNDAHYQRYLHITNIMSQIQQEYDNIMYLTSHKKKFLELRSIDSGELVLSEKKRPIIRKNAFFRHKESGRAEIKGERIIPWICEWFHKEIQPTVQPQTTELK